MEYICIWNAICANNVQTVLNSNDKTCRKAEKKASRTENNSTFREMRQNKKKKMKEFACNITNIWIVVEAMWSRRVYFRLIENLLCALDFQLQIKLSFIHSFNLDWKIRNCASFAYQYATLFYWISLHFFASFSHLSLFVCWVVWSSV